MAAAVALVLSATTVVLANVDSRSGADYQLHTLLLGSDLSLLAVAVLAAGGLREAVRSWRRHACVLGGLILGATMVPALLVNPSDRGLAALARWAGALALGLALGTSRRDGRRLVVGALAAVTLAHVAVALAQRAVDGTVGLGALGEAGVYEIGGRYASTGLTVHPYVLAAWGAVAGTVLLALGWRSASTSPLVKIAGVVAFAGIGLAMSRAGLVAGVLALAALGVAALRTRNRWSVTTVAAATTALGVGIVLNLAGWMSRAGQEAGSVDALSTGRGALLRQAWPLLRDHLLTGVGPGRYVLALSERPALVALSAQSPRPVHLTPLLLLVEGGLLVLPALILLAVAIVRACLRGGAASLAVTLAMLPFLALDHLAWSYPQGIVLTGVWLGALDLLSQRGDGSEDNSSDEAAAEGRW